MSRNYIGVEGSRYAADMIRKHTVLEQLLCALAFSAAARPF